MIFKKSINFVRVYGLFLFLLCTVSLLSVGNTCAAEPEQKSAGAFIRIGVSGDVDTFNPLFIESKLGLEIADLLFVGLADLNDKSEWVPELATSWEKSDDNLRLTFHLQKDALWADGEPITANDVRFTYELKRDKLVGTPRLMETELIEDVLVSDPYTVTFIFKEVYPEQMFDAAGEVLPKHVFEKTDRQSLRAHDFGRNPLSSGPFKLKRWVSQQYIELVPNERYFGKQPHLQQVVFKIVPDETNLLMQLRTGQIDMLLDVPIGEVDRLKKAIAN